MKETLLAFMFFTLHFHTLAHQDITFVNDFDNVHIRVKTGYQYEQIQIAFIIGKLGAKLSKKLNYSQPLFLDFIHAYIEDIKPNYYVNFGKGKMRTKYSQNKEYGILEHV